MIPPARLRLTHSEVRTDREGQMPLFPYLPVIVWMGVLKIVLGGAQYHEGQGTNDPADWTEKRIGVLPFPAPLTAVR